MAEPRGHLVRIVFTCRGLGLRQRLVPFCFRFVTQHSYQPAVPISIDYDVRLHDSRCEDRTNETTEGGERKEAGGEREGRGRGIGGAGEAGEGGRGEGETGMRDERGVGSGRG